MKKLPYEAPEAERIDVSFERSILSDPVTSESSSFNETANTREVDESVWRWM